MSNNIIGISPIYLSDIVDRIERIEAYTQDRKDTFYQSLLIQDAVIRCFEVIGEAVKLNNSLLRSEKNIMKLLSVKLRSSEIF